MIYSVMPPQTRSSDRIQRTTIGAVTGIFTSLGCWILLFILSLLDDSSHWEITLPIAGILLPVCCAIGGVIVSRSYINRLNYVVANLGVSILATILTIGVLSAFISLTLPWSGLLGILLLLGWSFVEQQFISAFINSWVDWLSGPPP